MTRAGTVYLLLLQGLAAIGAAILGAIALMIVFDVSLRNLGIHPPAHTLALTEYGLYFATLLGAPWLVRTKGHVQVELLTGVLPEKARYWLGQLSIVVCIGVCLVVGGMGIDIALDDFARGAFDMRSFDMPKGLLTAALPPSMLLMAVEFCRSLLGITETPGSASEPGSGM